MVFTIAKLLNTFVQKLTTPSNVLLEGFIRKEHFLLLTIALCLCR